MASEKIRRMTRRTWLLAVGITAGVGAVGFVGTVSLALALGVLGEVPPPPGSEAAVANAGGEESQSPLQLVPRATPTPTPTSTPQATVIDPSASGVLVGGDQPSVQAEQIPVVVPIAENQGVSPEFLSLPDVLAGEIAAYQEQVGDIEVAIAVTDLQTGQTISVNGNNLQRTGCTINMFALFVAVEQFQGGWAQPEQVAYSIRSGIGGSYPPEVRRFLIALKDSLEAGVVRAQEMMAAWGLRSSRFDHVPYYGDGTQSNYLTALETNLVLSKLYRGELFDPEWTAYTIQRLREVNWGLNYILPGRLPSAATVAHKIGYYWDYDGWVNNDVGIVTFTGADGQEKAYAITYLSQKARTEYTGYSFGATLSRMVWDWFDAKYIQALPAEPPPPPPPPPPPEPTPPPPEPTPTPPPPTPIPPPSPTPQPTPRR